MILSASVHIHAGNSLVQSSRYAGVLASNHELDAQSF